MPNPSRALRGLETGDQPRPRVGLCQAEGLWTQHKASSLLVGAGQLIAPKDRWAVARILVADDDSDIRELVSLKLRAAGFDVRTAEDGGLAWEAIQADPPDLAILDVMMPAMDGLEVLRTVRAHEDTRHLIVVMLTARSRETDVSEGFASGANEYMLKPFSPRELVRRVQDLLAGGGADR